MTTLHVQVDHLRSATAAYPVVKDLRVSAHFPHRLDITVVEHGPVAVAGGRRRPPRRGRRRRHAPAPVPVDWAGCPPSRSRRRPGAIASPTPARFRRSPSSPPRRPPCVPGSSAWCAPATASRSRCAPGPTSTSGLPTASRPSGSPPRGCSPTPRRRAPATSTCGYPSARRRRGRRTRPGTAQTDAGPRRAPAAAGAGRPRPRAAVRRRRTGPRRARPPRRSRRRRRATARAGPEPGVPARGGQHSTLGGDFGNSRPALKTWAFCNRSCPR